MLASGALPARARAVRSLAAAIRAPGDLLLVARVVLWSAALPVLKRVLPLPELARLMWQRPVGARSPERLGLRDNCLERSLIAYRLLSAAGARPRLVVAVASDPGGLRGHVWVTVDGRPVHDHESALEGFAATIVFGDAGRAEDAEFAPPASDGVA